MGDVIEANITTTVPMSADKILQAAIGRGLDDTLIIGWDANGDLYFAGTTSKVPEVLYLLEAAKFALMSSDNG